MNVFQFFIICQRTNNANNATYNVKLGKKRRENSKRNYYIISPRVIIKAIIIIHTYIQTHTHKHAHTHTRTYSVYTPAWRVRIIRTHPMCTNKHTHTHTHAHSCTHTRTHTHTLAYTRIHQHTHTQTQPP